MNNIIPHINRGKLAKLEIYFFTQYDYSNW